MKQRESIASRLSTTVTLIMVLTVVLISAAVYWRANRMVSSEVQSSAFSQMTMVVGDIDTEARKALRLCEQTAEAARPYVQGTVDTAGIDSLLRATLKACPDLRGCNVTLTHGAYSPHAFINDEGRHVVQNLARTMPHYAKCHWFRQVQNSWEPLWVDPADADGAPCTLAVPLFGSDSAFLGIVGIDMGNTWLDTLTRNVRIFDHSYCLVLTPSGICLNHPDTRILINESTPGRADEIAADIQQQVSNCSRNQKRGSAKVRTPEFRATCFFLPIESTGWKIAIVCPFTDAYAGLESFLFFTMLIILLFSIVLIAVLNAAIAKATAPISEFAKMARKVAVGEFDAKLPEKGQRSEMVDLYESFGFMQESLARNIEELKKTTAEQERLESEFHIARKIQLDLVPNIFPAFPERQDIDIHAVINPWRESGGNLYDFGIVDNRLLFCIGDVAGKGMMAAIFMSTTFKLIHSALYNHASPAETLSFANKTMALNNDSDMFVTLFFGALDLETGRLTYCNAGQDEPMLVAPDGSVAPLEVLPNVPVGLMQETEYEEQTTTIAPGSMLVLYTDGVVEAQNRSGDLYGADRLMRRIKTHAQKNCQQVVEAIREDVREFTHNETQDDCTALAIRWR